MSLMINNKDNIPAGRTTTFYCRRAFHFSGRQQQQPTILQIVRWSFPSLARLSSCHAPSSYSKFPFLHTHSGSSSRHHLGLACIGGVTRVALICIPKWSPRSRTVRHVAPPASVIRTLYAWPTPLSVSPPVCPLHSLLLSSFSSPGRPSICFLFHPPPTTNLAPRCT